METKRVPGHVGSNSVSPVTAREKEAEPRKASVGKNPFANLRRSLIELVKLKKKRTGNVPAEKVPGSVDNAINRDLARQRPTQPRVDSNDARSPIRVPRASNTYQQFASTQGGASKSAPPALSSRRDTGKRQDWRNVQMAAPAELADPFLRKFVDALASTASTRSTMARSASTSVNETVQRQDSRAKPN